MTSDARVFNGRIGIFCDVQSLWFAAKLWAEKRIDYIALGAMVRNGRDVRVCTAFLVEREGIEKFEHALGHMGYNTETSTRNNIEKLIKTAMLAAADEVDVIALVTGQGMYHEVIRELRARGKRVELWTFPIIGTASPDLASEADAHLKLDASVLEAARA